MALWAPFRHALLAIRVGVVRLLVLQGETMVAGIRSAEHSRAHGQAKLEQYLPTATDSVLCDYVIVMVGNKKTSRQVALDLEVSAELLRSVGVHCPSMAEVLAFPGVCAF